MISLDQKGAGEGELNSLRVQLVQIKYVLAGILGLAVYGKTGDFTGDLWVVLNVFLLVYLIEHTDMAVSKLPAALSNWKAARSDARMNALLAEARRANPSAPSRQTQGVPGMLEVRRIEIGEAALYRAVRLRALADAPTAFCTTHAQAMARDEESWREQADGSVEGCDRAIFLALSQGEPVGLAALYRHPEEADVGELLQVWVAPELRGSGAADALLNALFRWGTQEAGFSRVVAEVKANNARALGFYRKYGFSDRPDIQASDPDEIVLEWISAAQRN